ncbi:Lrp/AsnC family transcriptional regulator [Kitasatospora sp. NBC_01302]|uniref:Lrp/AsnC family transcriptional regulator n=1 Tax=Kitasatospora sp. NBC_01302 TaxID=2903575 RepID=UPI002E119FFC|nr:Lrp/AsnC family transcriptional regulator [Kitasatospora sp. NBC_01302]
MLDDLDRALIHALRIDGRAPFSRIAAVLDVSPQTVGRRYRQLRAEASLRVVGLADPERAGRAQWLVRLSASPHSAQDVAQALVRRPDTSWVKLTSGGTEITAIVNTTLSSASHTLLLRDIPRTASITAVSAHCLLHTYLGGPTGWQATGTALTAEQQLRLAPSEGGAAGPGPAAGPGGLGDADHHLLAALQRDGRAGLAELAAATGWSPATIARRLAELRAGGTLFFDVEVDSTLFGAATQALLWLSVAPGRLHEVATALARHPELAYVAATTGPTNLVANALCSGPADLHAYLAHRLGALRGIHCLESSPVLRTLKAAGPVLPAPPRRRG